MTNGIASIFPNSKLIFNSGKEYDFLLESYPYDEVDYIIMNPPYIAYNDKKVENNVKTHEPKLALYAKNNGLYYYQLVLNYLPYLMNKTITCYFEINQDHTKFLTKIINNL